MEESRAIALNSSLGRAEGENNIQTEEPKEIESKLFVGPQGVEFVRDASLRERVIRGAVDQVEGGVVHGWVLDESDPFERLEIEVLVEGKVVAIGRADLMRNDLMAAGIGDGQHGFAIAIPPHALGKKPKKVSVRVLQSGRPLGKPQLASFAPNFEGRVDGLDGITIAGWCRNTESQAGPVTLWLFDDAGVHIATALANQPHSMGDFGFRFILPPSYCDGRPHSWTVRVAETAYIVGAVAEVIPFISTPWESLQQHAPTALLGNLSPLARHRYESLRRQLARLDMEEEAAEKDGSQVIAAFKQRMEMLHTAHEQLIRGFSDPKRKLPPLSFPKHEKPLVSVVVPVHNKFPVTYNCLAALLFAYTQATFEVIVVDDGSTDKTIDLSELVEGIEILRNEEAQGFVKSSNLGATHARGEYVVMLNNDTEVTCGWLDALIEPFTRFDDVGMTGAKFIYPDGKLQEAGGIIWGNGAPANYGRNDNAYAPQYNYVRQVDYISGACIMLPTALWKELGGFDLAFAPAYFEDTDLAFRVREKGYKTMYTPFAEVVHYEGMSSGTSTTSGIKRYQKIHEPIFKKRWVLAFRHNGVIGRDPDIVKDRNVSYRALVIDAGTPRPDMDAGSYAAIQEMRLLQSFGIKLMFASENMAYLGNYTAELQRMGIECLYAPFYHSVDKVIETRGKELDLIYVTRYGVAQKYVDHIRHAAPQAKILFNNADLHFLRELRAAVAKGSQELLQTAIETRDAELEVMRKVDLVLSYNEVEHAVILSHNLDSTRTAECPWVVDVPKTVPAFADRQDIAFLGGYGHPPNVEAVEYFVEQVMPLLRRRLQGVRFLVYGSQVPEAFEKLDSEDVVIKGFVQDVAEVYDTCRVFVTPLLSGAGLKGKLAGALAHGVPSVVTPVAAEGMGLRDGLEVRIVQTPETWVEAIAGLYEDEAAWMVMSEAARKFAQQRFSFDAGRERFRQALEEVELFV